MFFEENVYVSKLVSGAFLNDKVALLAKSCPKIFFDMEYVVHLGLQIPELKILFYSDIHLLRYYMSKSGKSTTLATTFFLFFILFIFLLLPKEQEISFQMT